MPPPAAEAPFETARERWTRRGITIPGMLCALPLLTVALPLLAGGSLLLDCVRGRGFPRTRLLLFAIHYSACESLGLLASFGLWLEDCVRPDRERSLRRHTALQAWWAASVFAGVRLLFGVRLCVSGCDSPGPGPLLVFIHHASLLDTLLPALVLARQHGIRLRYVLKRELLWDPCLDVVGNRLPNVFVLRGSADSAAEIERVGRLAHGLRAGEGVLIYPEGTRFTPERRDRARQRIEASGNLARLERARRLVHLLPPRTGGPLALLDACPEADVLLVGHVGLEGFSHLRDFLSGGLHGRRIEVRLWRVPRTNVPQAREKKIAWLDEAWQRMDTWIDRQQSAAPKYASATEDPR